MSPEKSHKGINQGERAWLNTVGGLLGWDEEQFLVVKYFTQDLTVPELEIQRSSHLNKISKGARRFPYIQRQVDIYNDIVTFRASRFIDKHADVKNLTPDDRERYDTLMKFATAVAFADISGILSREEIQRTLNGEKVSPQVRGRDIY